MKERTIRSRTRWPGRALVALLLVVPAACRPPLQSGGVDVRPGAAERLGIFCRWRQADLAAPAFCPRKPAGAPRL